MSVCGSCYPFHARRNTLSKYAIIALLFGSDHGQAPGSIHRECDASGEALLTLLRLALTTEPGSSRGVSGMFECLPVYCLMFKSYAWYECATYVYSVFFYLNKSP
jgi:hypothetical protein